MDGLKDNLKRVKNVAELFANFDGEQQKSIENFLLIAAIQNEDKDNIVLNFFRNATPEQKEQAWRFLQELKERRVSKNEQDDKTTSITINVRI
ncbi:hypothetical protein [Tissierella praeacuta]|uniref:hypothetical protein n=1 Tax=Tissierella praeacuta TaxID=43131 RepID=UPI00333E8692